MVDANTRCRLLIALLLLLVCENFCINGFVRTSTVQTRPATTTRRHTTLLQALDNAKVTVLLPAFPPDALIEASNEIASSFSTMKFDVVSCDLDVSRTNTTLNDICQQANLLIALGIDTPMDVKFVATLFRLRRTAYQETNGNGMPVAQFALGGKLFAPLMCAWDEANPPPNSWQLQIPFNPAAQDRSLMLAMQKLFVKGETADFVEAIKLFLDAKT